MTVRNLEHVFQPRSVAVIGASRRSGALGHTVLANIREAGFAGRLYPVNPKYEEIDGLTCFSSVAALPEAPALAVIATPASTVPDLVAGLGGRGTRAAVVLTAGLTRENGLAQAMLDAGRPHTLRIVGPNCLGVLVPRLGLNASFAHLSPAPGRLALLSQSGALVTAMLDTAAGRGIGFSKIVSLGDMADVDVGDCLDLLAGDRDTSAILVYLETVSRAAKFMSAARAAARVKPVIVVKSGRHAHAAQAAATHTGALAGADRVADAAFRRAGLLRVASLEELFDAAEVLARYRPVKSGRLAILTNGGGAGVLAVDALEDIGGELAELSDHTIAALDAVLPPTWSHANPVDIIGDAGPDRWEAAARAILADENADGLLALCCPTALASSDAAADALIAAASAHRGDRMRPKPVLSVWLGEATVGGARSRLREAGIASLADPGEGVASFAWLARWSAAQAALMCTPPRQPDASPPDIDGARARLRKVAGEGRTTLTEPESKAVLEAFGLPTVPTLVVPEGDDIAAPAAQLLARHEAVVVKILSPDLTHKSDVGGVVLGLGTPEEAAAAARAMIARARRARPGARIEGVSLQPMVETKQAHELILGIDHDPIFGPVMMFGAGGTAVEVIADSAVALPPLDLLLARGLIDRTRIARLLAGYRDRPPVDRDALALALVRLSRIAVECPEIVSLDINPMLASPDGVIALDARVVIDPERIGEPSPNRRLAIRPYPSEWERHVETRGGLEVFLRPIKPEDEALYPPFMARLEEHDVRLRFLGPRKTFDHDMLARLTQIDYARAMAFVALGETDGELLGVARVHTDPDGVTGEYAILVRSDLKGKGLGWTLMEHLIAYARAAGIATLTGDVLAENTGMLAMCRELGFSVHGDPDAPEVSNVRLSLQEEGAART